MKNLALCTATCYQSREGVDGVRLNEARKTIESAKHIGLSIFVVDESPNDWVVDAFMNIGGKLNIRKVEFGTRFAARATAVEMALEHAYRPFWLEPEKANLVTARNLAVMNDMLDNGYSIVVPYRTADGMRTYPDFQIVSETLINRELDTLTGLQVDWTIGPRLMHTKAAKMFIEHHRRPGVKWDALMTFIIEARSAGLRVGSAAVDFHYPEAQREIETDNPAMIQHRANQRETISAAVRAECVRLGVTPMPGYVLA